MDSELISFHGVRFAYPAAERLTRRFPALRGHALEELTFSVKNGSATVLLGGNGSGKSTLLQLCNGLLAPDAGEILWQGKPMDRSRLGLARLRSQVGLVFQDPDDQIFAGTVAEDVAFGPQNQGLTDREVKDRVEEALACLGMEAYGNLPPHLLSHGMRKRVALAGVLAIRPRLLLLDEPTAGLDAQGQEMLVGVLDTLVASGTAVILSSHDLELAAHWASDALILSQGRLEAFGKIDQILTNAPLLAASGLTGRFPVRSGRAKGCEKNRHEERTHGEVVG